ncbi:hypothetical protein QQZ08_010401 [Neonectria magnoliae]|uniref:Uncharacterized protein n=1 Tax=Neonectria magnoliae TaxID=2732573 RepID=A0ABR1HI05_9HYPO
MGFAGTPPENDEFDENRIRALVAQGLVTFVVLGTLEPIRQQRPEIEICGMGMFSQPPILQRRQNLVCATIVGFLGLAVVTGLLELILHQVLGRRVDLPRFWFPEDLNLTQTFVHAWLLSPLLDIVETVVYVVRRIIWPAWFQGRITTIRNQP